jgi:hypothetical protein
MEEKGMDKKKAEKAEEGHGLGIKELRKARYAVLFERKGMKFLSVSIPRHDSQLFSISGEILAKMHRKVKEKKLPVRLHSVSLPVGMNPAKVVYSVEDEGVFEEVYEIFHESMLESSFSDPLRFTAVQEATAEFNLRMMRLQKAFKEEKEGKSCGR